MTRPTRPTRPTRAGLGRPGGHLGAALSALVDGELDHDRRDRALAHVAHCLDCRRDLEAERQLKARLRDATSGPPAELTRRLLAVGESGAGTPAGTSPQASGLPVPPASLGRTPRTAPRASHRPATSVARRTAVLAVGAVTIGGGAISGAFLLGGGLGSGLGGGSAAPVSVRPASGSATPSGGAGQREVAALGAPAVGALAVLAAPDVPAPVVRRGSDGGAAGESPGVGVLRTSTGTRDASRRQVPRVPGSGQPGWSVTRQPQGPPAALKAWTGRPSGVPLTPAPVGGR